jgi:hypothetical protein
MSGRLPWIEIEVDAGAGKAAERDARVVAAVRLPRVVGPAALIVVRLGLIVRANPSAAARVE